MAGAGAGAGKEGGGAEGLLVLHGPPLALHAPPSPPAHAFAPSKRPRAAAREEEGGNEAGRRRGRTPFSSPAWEYVVPLPWAVVEAAGAARAAEATTGRSGRGGRGGGGKGAGAGDKKEDDEEEEDGVGVAQGGAQRAEASHVHCCSLCLSLRGGVSRVVPLRTTHGKAATTAYVMAHIKSCHADAYHAFRERHPPRARGPKRPRVSGGAAAADPAQRGIISPLCGVAPSPSVSAATSAAPASAAAGDGVPLSSSSAGAASAATPALGGFLPP